MSQCAPHNADADDLLCCSATVGNLGERGEADILTYVRRWDLSRALRTGQSTRDLRFKHESELHGNGAGRESNPGPLAFKTVLTP